MLAFYHTQYRPNTRCNTLQHTATYLSLAHNISGHAGAVHQTATHYSTLQHSASHYITLQHSASITLHHTATYPMLAHNILESAVLRQRPVARNFNRQYSLMHRLHFQLPLHQTLLVKNLKSQLATKSLLHKELLNFYYIKSVCSKRRRSTFFKVKSQRIP